LQAAFVGFLTVSVVLILAKAGLPGKRQYIAVKIAIALRRQRGIVSVNNRACKHAAHQRSCGTIHYSQHQYFLVISFNHGIKA